MNLKRLADAASRLLGLERRGGQASHLSKGYGESDVIRALAEAGVPSELHDAFIRFQMEHGGKSDRFILNTFRWGIIHRNPEWLKAGKVEAEEDDENPGIWHVACADCHPSDYMTLDQNGSLYWSWKKRYESYEDYFAGKEPLEWTSA